ncbi:suppressor of fused domain protein [Bacillus thuringiensis]|uniref:suppressor of fused domain protein n=1 Tax=Bacillus thuringiensis TaxID=1428 RepID=UPI0033374AB3
MNFFRKNKLIEIQKKYYEHFGDPSQILEYTWGERGAKRVELDNTVLKKGMLYVLEFPKNEDRPVWTYVTLGMSAEYMINGAKGELIWLNANQNDEITDLLAGLAHYPFIDATSFDYGDTISNADTESDFSMNVLLVSPAVIEAGESPELMEFFEEKELDLFWLLPIHQAEKEYMMEQGDISALFDLWLEKEIDTETFCDPHRSSTV